jgi:HEAT repeat protein
MRRKGIILLTSLLALVFVALLWVGAGADSEKGFPNPLVQGIPLSIRMQKALATDVTANGDFLEALKPVAAEAVPYLLPALRHKDNPFNAAYVKIWPNLPGAFRRHLTKPILAKDLRLRAVVILREFGSPANAAIPDLIERLSEKDGDIRLLSAIALGNMGPDAKSALPSLEPLLQSNLDGLRVYTAQAVWKITKKAEPSLSTLEAVLGQGNIEYRWAAAAFLGEMGPTARPAIPLLTQAAHAADKDVASLSVQALAGIGAETLPMLTEVLTDATPTMRISAAVALGRLGPKSKGAAPLLTNLLQDQAVGSPLFWGNPNRWPKRAGSPVGEADRPSTLFRFRPEQVGEAAAKALIQINSP